MYPLSKRFLFLICCLGWCAFAVAQAPYRAGTARVSLEPQKSIFSLALAGYGLPREGRFSITWQSVGEAPMVAALTSLNGKLYAATASNELLVATPAQSPLAWRRIGKANSVKALTGLGNKLYAVSQKNGVLEGIVTGSSISWKKAGKTTDITSLTSLNGKLYAATPQGQLLAGTPSNKGITWSAAGITEGAFSSLTSDGDRLYAVNAQDSLWAGKPDGNYIKWTQIGSRNGVTFTIHVKQLAVVEERLYAFAGDGKLYINDHSTEGNLSATALAVQSGANTAVLVGVDLCGFNDTFIHSIKEEIYRKRNIPPSAILINSSHTHFAPITQDWPTLGTFYEKPNDIYMQNVVRKGIVMAIEVALDNMSPSYLSFSRSTSNIGKNRRAAANPAKPYDNSLDVLQIVDSHKNIKSILFLAGCHPVFKNAGKESFTISANYPGVARKLIEEKAGIEQALFLQGCGGDINPLASDYKQTGTTLATDALAVLGSEMGSITGGISYYMDSIHFPIRPWTVEELQAFKAKNSEKKGDVYIEKNVRWADLMLEQHRKGTVQTTLPVYIQTINIGNWKLIGLSREAVNEYATAIKAIWPDKDVSVAGYCNDVSSYLPRDWHIQTSVYEGNDSFFWYGQPGIFPINVLDVIVNRISQQNR